MWTAGPPLYNTAGFHVSPTAVADRTVISRTTGFSQKTFLCGLLIALLLLTPQVVFAQKDRELRERTLQAIERAENFITSQQNPDGSWDYGNYTVGATSLVTLSMLYSGRTADDPSIVRALTYLRGHDSEFTYDVSLKVMVLALAGQPQDLGRIRQLADWLVRAQHSSGSWGYKIDDNTPDNSNAQFAILGLREAAHAGIEIPRSVWQKAQEHWLRDMKGNPDRPGSQVYWYYRESDPHARGSMQVAAISSLSITSEFLQDDSDVDARGIIDCCGARQDERSQLAIEASFRWLATQFRVDGNPGQASNHWKLYYLYGLERAGRFTGRRFILGDQHDWYRDGVRHLVGERPGEGIQNSEFGGFFDSSTEQYPAIGTAQALLFLSKGNSPILINKLKYNDPQSTQFNRGWNRHPREVANLTEAISGRPRWPKLMSWQVVDLDVAAKNDRSSLLQAKVQYLSGDGPLTSLLNSPHQIQLLREYIFEQGGFLFAVRNCQSPEFDADFRTLVEKIFESSEYQLKKLPATHDVYRSEYVMAEGNEADVPELWGVDIGCRTAIIYAPDDHACRWRKWMRHDPANRLPNVKVQINRSMRLATNVIAYATGRELLDALIEPEPLDNSDLEGNRGKLVITRLRHTGGWDTAPSALRNLQTALKTVGINAASSVPSLPATDPTLFDHPMLYMHGRKNFTFTEAEKDRLKKYLEQGGFLFADACCGEPQFDESFRKLMEELFPGGLETISVDHKLMQNDLAHDIRKVRRRLPEAARPGAPLLNVESEGAPILEGIRLKAGGPYVVVYSKYDLSCALERQATVNCPGYTNLDATRIAVNIIVYALLR